MPVSTTVIRGGTAAAIFVLAGERVRVTNTFGGQVVDTWAFNRHDTDEFMSMEHSRPALLTLRPKPGHRFVSNRRNPIVSLLIDASPGIHDITMPPCDRYRYAQLGVPAHANCQDNLTLALKSAGISCPITPGPLNLFQNSPVHEDLSYTFEPSPARPGDYVELGAEMDLVFVFSACPMDIMPINNHVLRDVEVAVRPWET